MSASVDVLAVLDEAIDRRARPHEAGLHAAHAAIAELIEAAADAHDFAANTARHGGIELDRRFYRLRAAIVKCRGESNG